MKLRQQLGFTRFLTTHSPRLSVLDQRLYYYIEYGDVASYQLWDALDVEFPADLPLVKRFMNAVCGAYPYLVNFYFHKLTQHAQPAVAALSQYILEHINLEENDAIEVLTNIAEWVPANYLEHIYENFDGDQHILFWSFSIFAQYHPEVVGRYLEEYAPYAGDFHKSNAELKLKPQNYFVQALATCLRAGCVFQADFSQLIFNNSCDLESCTEDIAFCLEGLEVHGFPHFEYVCAKNHEAICQYAKKEYSTLQGAQKLDFLNRQASILADKYMFPHGLRLFVCAAAQVEDQFGRQRIQLLVEAVSLQVGAAAVEEALALL